MALYGALFVVLDFIANTFNLFVMPQGGRLSLGTIALILASYHLGWKEGVVVSVVSVFLMLVTGSVNYYGMFSFLFDYLLAYAVYGLSSVFPNYKKLYCGIIVTSLIRLAFSTLSGIVVWEVPFWGSLSYNASYIIPTMIMDLIIVPLLYEKLVPLFKK
ncbi:MAG TPA: energy-coupled thiamine transporter ThiT [Erysipelotrichaceae bacterium]|nr:energy-coupled thiamine transporter ThiT [Erysipelotrichaceae bacterium]